LVKCQFHEVVVHHVATANIADAAFDNPETILAVCFEGKRIVPVDLENEAVSARTPRPVADLFQQSGSQALVLMGRVNIEFVELTVVRHEHSMGKGGKLSIIFPDPPAVIRIGQLCPYLAWGVSLGQHIFDLVEADDGGVVLMPYFPCKLGQIVHVFRSNWANIV
jgi:hypothetical protein